MSSGTFAGLIAVKLQHNADRRDDMQSAHIRAGMMLLVFLAVAGGKDRFAPSRVDAAAQGASAPANKNDIPKGVIHVKSDGAHHVSRSGTTLTFEYDANNFQVNFNNPSPCAAASYPLILVPGSNPAVYKASCKVTAKHGTFSYDILPVPSAQKVVTFSATHCTGCVVDVEP